LLAVWAVLAVLVVVIVALELRDAGRAPSGAAADSHLLVPVPMDELGAVEIAEAGRLHRFERDAAGAWFYHGVHAGGEAAHTHAPDPVLAQRIERAVAAFTRTRTERQFALERRDAAAYGVATPDIVVLVYRPQQAQPLTQYAVGGIAPDTVSRYVLVVGRPVVFTIPGYQIDNLLALVQAAIASASTSPPGGSR
jgi:hypothetical protein